MEYRVKKEVKTYRIDAFDSDIIVRSSDSESPLVIYSGVFDILEENDSIVLKQQYSGNADSYEEYSYNFKDGTFLAAGSVLSGEKSIEVILPKNSDVKLEATTKSGNLSVTNLKLLNLKVTTHKGNIVLKEVDAVNSCVEANGNITAEILESGQNYFVDIKTDNATMTPIQDEGGNPEILPVKHRLKAKIRNGHMKVLFKGQN